MREFDSIRDLRNTLRSEPEKVEGITIEVMNFAQLASINLILQGESARHVTQVKLMLNVPQEEMEENRNKKILMEFSRVTKDMDISGSQLGNEGRAIVSQGRDGGQEEAKTPKVPSRLVLSSRRSASSVRRGQPEEKAGEKAETPTQRALARQERRGSLAKGKLKRQRDEIGGTGQNQEESEVPSLSNRKEAREMIKGARQRPQSAMVTRSTSRKKPQGVSEEKGPDHQEGHLATKKRKTLHNEISSDEPGQVGREVPSLLGGNPAAFTEAKGILSGRIEEERQNKRPQTVWADRLRKTSKKQPEVSPEVSKDVAVIKTGTVRHQTKKMGGTLEEVLARQAQVIANKEAGGRI